MLSRVLLMLSLSTVCRGHDKCGGVVCMCGDVAARTHRQSFQHGHEQIALDAYVVLPFIRNTLTIAHPHSPTRDLRSRPSCLRRPSCTCT
jgi:hypothetical protein